LLSTGSAGQLKSTRAATSSGEFPCTIVPWHPTVRSGSTTTDPGRKLSPALPAAGAASDPVSAGVPELRVANVATIVTGSPQSSAPLPFTSPNPR
jgi:hypothetical protein